MTAADIVAADPVRMRLLARVAALGLPQGAIGAGFVRNAVWDALHGRAPASPDTDLDVVWFDPARATPEADRRVEALLRAERPGVAWSVKNQARMHARNGDAPYASVADAIARWPETATAIAARFAAGRVEIVAPHGEADLMTCVLRPTPGFSGARRATFDARVADKGWLARWPLLRLAEPCPVDGAPARGD